jgi:hypothetical protein
MGYSFLTQMLGVFGVGFFIAGLLFSVPCLFWRQKWKWILSSLCFVGSAGSFLYLSFVTPWFGMDVVIMVLFNIVFFFIYEWVGWNSKK